MTYGKYTLTHRRVNRLSAWTCGRACCWNRTSPTTRWSSFGAGTPRPSARRSGRRTRWRLRRPTATAVPPSGWCCSRRPTSAASSSSPATRAARAVIWSAIRRPRCSSIGIRSGGRCASRARSSAPPPRSPTRTSRGDRGLEMLDAARPDHDGGDRGLREQPGDGQRGGTDTAFGRRLREPRELRERLLAQQVLVRPGPRREPGARRRRLLVPVLAGEQSAGERAEGRVTDVEVPAELEHLVLVAAL